MKNISFSADHLLQIASTINKNPSPNYFKDELLSLSDYSFAALSSISVVSSDSTIFLERID